MISLSSNEYQEIWQSSPVSAATQPELIQVCAEQFGVGCKRSTQIKNIMLLIHDYQLTEDLQIHYPDCNEEEICLEFGFQLSGNRCDRSAGQNFFYGGYEEGDSFNMERANSRILQVDIHLDSIELLQTYAAPEIDRFPIDLQQILSGSDRYLYDDINTITPAMQTALDQLLHCPFSGLTRQLYLESKCLELVALKLEQLSHHGSNSPMKLKLDDVERIHQATVILSDRLENPPSLIELARQVGLNDYKLKVGFRQVLGTTAFGYLWAVRMERARQLLIEGRLNVKEVARSVGYVNQSRFAAAFRKKFGVNPKSYLTQQF